MGNSLKKAFSTFVTLTTVLWSVGAGALAFPNAAAAATLSAGALVKASGPAVYYYAADGKRYVFPNEKTYFSWFTNFSSVQTITDAELAALPIGGNVTIRPGTYLVKITTDPKTYAVTLGGVLHWIQSEAVAQALYGSNWAQRVVDVPDSFFVNYTVGSSISTNVHPDGTLITYAGDTNTYIMQGGVKRKFADSSTFAANGLNSANVITTTITYGNGTDVTGREGAIADVVYISGSATVGGNLTVALASDTPAGMTVPRNASSVPLVKVNLTAGSSDVVVTGLSFHRVGVGATSDFSNVYLYDQSGKRLTTGRTINSQTNIVEFNNLNITVPAGQTWAVLVYGDFAGASANVGGQHSFELVDAASVMVSAGTVAGSFPVRGNVFTVGTQNSARVDVAKGTTPANPNIGSTDAEVANFKVTANTDDVTLKQVTVYEAGTAAYSDISNLNLYQGTTLVASAPSVDASGHAVLKFTTPYLITNGTTKVFSLHATVGGRAGRTIRTYVEYSTDVTAMDMVYNAGAQVDISTNGSYDGSGFVAGTSGCDTPGNSSCVVTQGGTLTNAFNGPATSDVAKGALGVQLYKFSLSSPDNALEIRKMVFKVAATTGGSCKVVNHTGTTDTNYFRSLKIKNLDTGVTMMGPLDFAGTGASQPSASLTYTDSFTINAGQTMNLALVADLSNTEVAAGDFVGCGYQASFTPFGSTDVRVVSTGEFLDTSKIVPNSAVTGNTLTVKASSLNVDLASAPGSDTIVKKQQNVPVAGLTLSASAQSDITVTSITLAGQAALSQSGVGFGPGATAATAAANFAQRVTSLALFDGTTQVGKAMAPDTTTGKAQITNMNLVVPKGSSKTLLVEASFSSTASTTAPYDQVSVGVAQASDIQAQDQDSNTVNPALSSAIVAQATGASPTVVMTVLNSGTLTVQANAHPASTIVVAGNGAWVPFAQYKATAQYEDIQLSQIMVSSTGAGNDADFSSVAVASNGAVVGQGTLPSGAVGTSTIDFSTNPLTVPKGGSVTFQLWAKLSSVVSSSSASGVSRSGDAPALGVYASGTTGLWDAGYAGQLNIRAVGSASGERVYAAQGASAGNEMVLRKSLPVVTKQSLSSTTLSNIDQDLIRFQVAADAAGPIAVKQMVFSFDKSAAVALSNFRLLKGNSPMTSTDYSIVNATSGADLTAASTLAAGVNTGYVVVTFTNEEQINGSGNVYTLHANVSGATGGTHVTFQFYRDPSAPIVTGYLKNSYAFGGFGSSASIFNIDTAAAPSGAAAATGTFLWSDDSEALHSSASQVSRDWTNDVYVQDLSQSQSLSL